MFVAAILVLALTRAEIIERMKAPVITQCDGLVQVYADCPEDMRREFQMPIASFAADTVRTLYGGLSLKPKRYGRPGIIVHVGDVRTNLTEVAVRASTNASGVVSRIYLKSPAYADLYRYRLELVKAFCRCVKGDEVDDAGAVAVYRKADPRFRLEDERARLADWLAGRLPSPTPESDEENLKLMQKVIEPGRASREDVLIFASRLYLYPPAFDYRFCGKYDCLSFREAVKCVKADPMVRLVAYGKSGLLMALGCGRGDALTEAARGYFEFLQELAKAEKDEDGLLDLLEAADTKLNVALEEAKR